MLFLVAMVIPEPVFLRSGIERSEREGWSSAGELAVLAATFWSLEEA